MYVTDCCSKSTWYELTLIFISDDAEKTVCRLLLNYPCKALHFGIWPTERTSKKCPHIKQCKEDGRGFVGIRRGSRGTQKMAGVLWRKEGKRDRNDDHKIKKMHST